MINEIDNLRKELLEKFLLLESKLKILSSINRTDFALELENFMIPICNIILENDFENINKKNSNYKGIDLMSKNNKIGIQITINSKREKVIDTVEKVKELYEQKEIKQLFIFVLSSKTYRELHNLETKYFEVENLFTIKEIIEIEDSNKIDAIRTYIKAFENKKFHSEHIKYLNLIDKYFVETKHYSNVRKKLEKNNTVILTGNAGVGKTITSYKIYGELLIAGYMPIEKFQDINPNIQKYVLFNDDFITATKYENINFEKVREIFDMIDINDDHLIDVKIIINSRINIYKNLMIEDMNINFKKYKKYIYHIDGYTEIEKIELLKKYLLPNFKKENLLTLFQKGEVNTHHMIFSLEKNDNFDKIIKHMNFSPRLIEYYVDDMPDDINIGTSILKYLKSPDLIYDKQYKQLTTTSKNILKIIWLNEGDIKQNEIEKKLQWFKNVDTDEFNDELDKLENSFLLISRHMSSMDFEINFYNPSILDYLNKKYQNDISFERLSTKINNKKELLKIIKNQKINNNLKFSIISGFSNNLDVRDLNNIYKIIPIVEIKNIILNKVKNKYEILEEDIEILNDAEIYELIKNKKWNVVNYDGGLTKMAQTAINNDDLTELYKLNEKLYNNFSEEVDSRILGYVEEYKEYKINSEPFPEIDYDDILDKYENNLFNIIKGYFKNIEDNNKIIKKKYMKDINFEFDDCTNNEEYIKILNNIVIEIESTIEEVEESFEENNEVIKDNQLAETILKDKKKLENILNTIDEFILLLESVDYSSYYLSESDVEDVLENYLDGDYTLDEKIEVVEDQEYKLAKEKFILEVLGLKN